MKTSRFNNLNSICSTSTTQKSVFWNMRSATLKKNYNRRSLIAKC